VCSNAPSLYRFLSPDPVIPTDRALYNPQRWNLYAYCLGNPINYVDISGGQARRLIITRTISGPTGTFVHFRFEGKYLTIEGYTLERPWMDNKNDISCIPEGDYEAILHYWDRKDKNKENIWVLWLQNTGSRKGIFVHEGSTTEDTKGCILIGKGFDKRGNLTGGPALRKAILTDNALDLLFDSRFPLEWLSRAAHKTIVKVEKGKVYCEWQWVGYIDYINGIVYYFN
jgi:hypothetical protein